MRGKSKMTREEMLKIAKPILFNTEMVRAIQDGRKTVTRRICRIKVNENMTVNHKDCCMAEYPERNMDGLCANFYENEFYKGCAKPPYKAGDVLYVRETWCRGSLNYGEEQYYYKADDKIPHCQWNPSIHMPKEAARIFLRVTNVRVERLQDIDGYGILAEGVDNGYSNPALGKRWENMQRMAYSELWNSTVKKSDLEKYGWTANPWVWVIEFERLEVKEDKP